MKHGINMLLSGNNMNKNLNFNTFLYKFLFCIDRKTLKKNQF